MNSLGVESLESSNSSGASRPVATGSDSIGSRSQISYISADITPSDQRLLEAKERVQRDSKKVLTETPKLADLLGSFSVACIIANKMIGMNNSQGLGRTNKLTTHDI